MKLPPAKPSLWMNSSLTANFRKGFARLPAEIQAVAAKNFRLWSQDPQHPSLQFKPVGEFWSVRVGMAYRALGRIRGDRIYWIWIGHHSVYDRMVSRC